jgi:hypothetical protein
LLSTNTTLWWASLKAGRMGCTTANQNLVNKMRKRANLSNCIMFKNIRDRYKLIDNRKVRFFLLLLNSNRISFSVIHRIWDRNTEIVDSKNLATLFSLKQSYGAM